ncbi:MAG: hypothetical protein GWN62_02305 [Aliifodinibius sp.]|nr:hypothetical protein [Fodinibius sp.]
MSYWKDKWQEVEDLWVVGKAILTGRVHWTEFFKQLENLFDDPFDWVKEWFYNDGDGRRFWKWQIYFDCIMMNRTGNCRIERVK